VQTQLLLCLAPVACEPSSAWEARGGARRTGARSDGGPNDGPGTGVSLDVTAAWTDRRCLGMLLPKSKEVVVGRAA